MAITTPTATPKRRRSLRFSVKTLLIGVLLAGSGLGWFVRELEQARRQRLIAEVIRKLGGHADSEELLGDDTEED